MKGNLPPPKKNYKNERKWLWHNPPRDDVVVRFEQEQVGFNAVCWNDNQEFHNKFTVEGEITTKSLQVEDVGDWGPPVVSRKYFIIFIAHLCSDEHLNWPHTEHRLSEVFLLRCFCLELERKLRANDREYNRSFKYAVSTHTLYVFLFKKDMLWLLFRSLI